MSETFDFMDVQGLTTRPELEFMQDCAKQAKLIHEGGDKYIELGAFRGRATIALAQAVGDVDVVAFDNYVMQHHGENTAVRTRENFDRAGVKPVLLSRASTNIPDNVIKSIVFLMIDTDHRKAPLRREVEAWSPLLVSGGIVCMHDYNNPKWPEVTTFVDEHFVAPGWERVGLVEKMIAFRKQ